MIRKGDKVTIKPRWRDHGDEKYTWLALTDESLGRVDISPVDTGLTLNPIYVVNVDMLEQPQ